MTSAVQVPIEPTLSDAQVKQLFDVLVKYGRDAANDLAKSWNFKSNFQLIAQVEGNKVTTFLKETVGVVETLNKALIKSNAAADGSTTSLRQQFNTAKKLRDSITKLGVATDEYGRSVLKINPLWEKQNQQVQILNKQLQIAAGGNFFDRIRNSFDTGAIGNFGRSVSGIVNTFQSVGIILQQINGAVNLFVNSVKNIQSIGLTFESIGQGAAGAALALEESSRIALNLGVDLKATRTGFQQLSPVILQSGGSMEDVSKVVQALSSRFAVFGKSADEAKRITNAVVQAFGKGKLMSEELNQQIAEADPAFRVDLANALGVSTAALGEMVEQGEITADVLLKTIPLLDKSSIVYGKYGESATKAAGRIGEVGVTVQGVQSQIASLNQLSLERTGQLFLPLIKSIIGVQAVFTDLITTITKSETFKVLADIVNGLGAGFLELIKVIAKLIEILIKILDPFAKLLSILTQNEGLMKILGTIVIAALTIKLLLMAKAALAASAALTRLAIAQLLGKGGAAELGLEIAQFAGKGKLIGGVGKAFKALGPAAQNSLKFLVNGKSGLVAFKNAGTSIGPALTGTFKNSGTALKGLTTNVKESITTARAWRAGIIAVEKGATGTTGAFKALNGTFVKYSGETIKASTRTVTFASRTQAAIGQLVSGGGKGAKALLGIGRGIAAAAPSALGLTLVISQIAGGFANLASAGEPAKEALKVFGTLAKDAQKKFDEFKTSIGEGAPAATNFSTRIDALQRTQELAVQGTINFARSLVGLKADFELTSLEGNSFRQELVVITDELNKGTKIIGDYSRKLLELGRAQQTAESKAQAGQAAKAAVGQIDAETAAIKKKIAALNQEIPTTEDGRKARETSIAALQAELGLRESNRKIIIAQAAAAGADVTALDSEIVKRTALITKLEAELETRKKILEEQKKTSGEERDTTIKAIDKENDAFQKSSDKQIESINKVKTATEKRWEAEDRARTRSRQLADRAYDAELKRLDEVKAAIERAYAKPIQALQGQSPAESQLAALDKAELKKQAAQGETQRDKLQAQAQLERIAREEKIAALEKKKAEELAKVEAAREAKQKQIDAEKLKREEEDFKREEERRKKKEEFEDRLMKLQEEAARRQEEADNKKQEAQDKYESSILPFEQKVADIAKQINDERDKNKARVLELQVQGEKYNEILERELELTRLINIERGKKPSGGSGTGTTGGTQTNQRGGGTPKPKFAGGPVMGGGAYTVNELGPEAFLSRSGKLSMINAPSYGQWRAPGAGTVIPAHITAGLNIPAGGLSVNSGVASTVTRSSGNPMGSIASLLRGAIGAPQGRVTNNVTIQSQNPTRSASDILVEMTKIKRNRYR